MSSAKNPPSKSEKRSDDASSSSGRGKKIVHVRIDGKSKEFGLADLSLTARSPDEDIMALLAKHLRVDIERFALFSVERTKDGNLFLRPDAVFQER